MDTKFRKALVLTLTNFSEECSSIVSPPFSSGGCEWFVQVNPKHDTVDNYLSLHLSLSEPKSLGLNWKRKVRFYFVLLNQSREETYRTSESSDCSFCAKSSSWGWTKAFPLEKVLEKEVLVNDSFTIEVHIKVLEVHGIEKEPVDVNGFHVLSSQVASVKQIFVEHPDITLGFKSKNQAVKTTYMNVLLSLLGTVKKPLKSITETELSKAHSELCELTEVGFKLEWLKTKLEEVTLEKKASLKVELDEEKAKAISDAAKVLLLEKELSDLKTELANEKATFVSLKEAFSDLRVQLEKEKAKSAARALSLKETWSNLKFKKDHKKGNSAITDNLLTWEDADLVSPTKCLGNGYKRIN